VLLGGISSGLKPIQPYSPAMVKQELPKCSKPDCLKAAGIIMNGDLLCGEHASEALERRRAEMRKNHSAG